MSKDKKEREKENPSLKPSPDNSYLRYTGIAFELAAYNLVCIWGGYELSVRYSPGSHWVLILFVLLASAGTFYYLFKRLNS